MYLVSTIYIYIALSTTSLLIVMFHGFYTIHLYETHLCNQLTQAEELSGFTYTDLMPERYVHASR